MKKALITALIAAVASLGLSSCGFGAEPQSDPPPPPPELRSLAPTTHGPSPTPPPGIPDDLVERGATPPRASAVKQRLQKVVACMREKGYDMPDAAATGIAAPRNAVDPAMANRDSKECAEANRG